MTTLKPGDNAPDFSGIDQDGQLHRLADYKGRKLVIFFYPGADTPTCTKEACNLRDNYERFLAENFAIIGVSADTQKKQGKFCSKYSLPFPLIADVDREMINAYEIWGPKKFMGRLFDGLHRTTFVISADGKISDVIENVVSKDHSNQILN